MDGLIALFIVFGVISSLNKAAKKKMKQQKPKVPLSAFGQTVEKQPAMPAEEPIAVPVFASAEGQSIMGSLMAESTEGMDLCDPELEHDREIKVDPHSVYAGEIGAEHKLDLSPNGLWQGVVMSEILTRPCERNKRKGASWRN